jgi:hypothetical protein
MWSTVKYYRIYIHDIFYPKEKIDYASLKFKMDKQQERETTMHFTNNMMQLLIIGKKSQKVASIGHNT